MLIQLTNQREPIVKKEESHSQTESQSRSTAFCHDQQARTQRVSYNCRARSFLLTMPIVMMRDEKICLILVWSGWGRLKFKMMRHRALQLAFVTSEWRRLGEDRKHQHQFPSRVRASDAFAHHVWWKILSRQIPRAIIDYAPSNVRHGSASIPACNILFCFFSLHMIKEKKW